MRDSLAIKKILGEIDGMKVEDQLEVYKHLASKLKRREQILATLEKIKGKGKGLWSFEGTADAQAYVNRLRSNDRF